MSLAFALDEAYAGDEQQLEEDISGPLSELHITTAQMTTLTPGKLFTKKRIIDDKNVDENYLI